AGGAERGELGVVGRAAGDPAPAAAHDAGIERRRLPPTEHRDVGDYRRDCSRATNVRVMAPFERLSYPSYPGIGFASRHQNLPVESSLKSQPANSRPAACVASITRAANAGGGSKGA